MIKVTYKGGNGKHLNKHDNEKYLVIGQSYEVIGGFMCSSSSGYRLKDFPCIDFNTILFEKNEEAWDFLVRRSWNKRFWKSAD